MLNSVVSGGKISVDDTIATMTSKQNIFMLYSDEIATRIDRIGEKIEALTVDFPLPALRLPKEPGEAKGRFNVSNLIETALRRMSRDLQSGANPPWREYAETYRDIRQPRPGSRPHEGELSVWVSKEDDADIEIILRYAKESGVNFPNLRRGDAPNRKLAITLAILYTSDQIP